MMKLSTCCAALLLALASPAVLAAPGSCERIQSDISQRIINNGVPESSFTLSIVPNDQVDQPDSQVVGHCANDTHKILYTRTTSGNVSAPAQSTQDGAPLPNRSNTLSTERRIRHIRRFEHTT
jgi:hypothetical protein